MWSQRLRRSVVNLASPGQLFEDLGITYIGVVPGPRHPRAAPDLRAGLRAEGPGRSSTSGPRRAAATGPPSATRCRSMAPRCRRWSSRPRPMRSMARGETARSAAARARAAPATSRRSDPAAPTAPARTATRSPRRRPRAPPRTPSYTSVFVAELLELAKADDGSSRSPRACRPAPASRSSRPRSRSASTTSASPSSMRSRWPAASRSPGCGPSSRCTRRSSSGPSTRPSTTSARTTCRCCSRSTGRASSARTAPPTRACSRSRPSASCRTSSSPARRTSRSFARWSEPRSTRTTRSRCTTRAIPGFGLPAGEPKPDRGRAGGGAARGPVTSLFVGFGPIVMRAVEVADSLAADGWSIGVVNARFAKPLDRQLILDQARGKRLVVTFEESVVSGGFGSAVLEAVEEARLTDPALRETSVSWASRRIGSSTTAPCRPAAHAPPRRRGSRGAGSRGRGDPRPRAVAPRDGPRGRPRRLAARQRRWSSCPGPSRRVADRRARDRPAGHGRARRSMDRRGSTGRPSPTDHRPPRRRQLVVRCARARRPPVGTIGVWASDWAGEPISEAAG